MDKVFFKKSAQNSPKPKIGGVFWVLLLCKSIVYGQNLVPNHSFEELLHQDFCKTYLTYEWYDESKYRSAFNLYYKSVKKYLDPDFYTSKYDYSDMLGNWHRTNRTNIINQDIDYFYYQCDASYTKELDLDGVGKRFSRPKTLGKILIGIVSGYVDEDYNRQRIDWFVKPIPPNDFRYSPILSHYSHISTKLLKKIEKGKIYYGSFWATAAPYISKTNNIGLALSDTILPPIFNSDTVLTDNYINNNKDTVNRYWFSYFNKLCDSNIDDQFAKICPVVVPKEPIGYEWTLVEDCFVADKDYTTLIVGNVLPYEKSLVLWRYHDYRDWSDYNGPMFKNKRVKDTNFAHAIDEIVLMEANIPELPIRPNLGPDTSICKNSPPIVLSAPNPRNGEIQWHDGSRGETFVVTEPGIYWLDVILGPCKSRDSVIVYDERGRIPRKLPLDTLLCQGSSITLDVGLPNGQYKWQDGNTDPIYTIDREGKYSVEIKQAECEIKDELEVRYIRKPIAVPEDTVLCEGIISNIRLRAIHGEVVWPNGQMGGVYRAKVPSQVITSLSIAHCTFYDTINITITVCQLIIPNVFTPNGDGVNDTWMIDGLERARWRVSILNRYGQEVYHSQAYEGLWDGGGLPEAVYYYHLQSEQAGLEYRGWVMLAR